jgi:hypothetical protein
MKMDALISECGTFRYMLERTWDEYSRHVLFIMLNPSTADAVKNDQTITRCCNFARSWGYGGILVGNLFAFRSKEPKDLLPVSDPIGPDNEKHLIDLSKRASLIVLAWGNGKIVDKIKKRYPDYKPLKAMGEKKFHYLKLSSDGTPYHPLYLPKTLTPTPY